MQFKNSTAMKSSMTLMILILLSACGYHLRGALQLPEALKKIYIQGASAELKQAITTTFRSASGSIVTNPADAGMVLNVIHEDYQRRTISLNADGYSNEYELIYQVTFEMLDSQGAELVAEQTVKLSKAYFNEQSSDTVLSKGNEEAVLRKGLYEQAVRSIVERTKAQLKKQIP